MLEIVKDSLFQTSGYNCYLFDADNKLQRQPGDILGSSTSDQVEKDVFSRIGSSKNSRKYDLGLSCSDAEVDYRRGRSLREAKGNGSWHD